MSWGKGCRIQNCVRRYLRPLEIFNIYVTQEENISFHKEFAKTITYTRVSQPFTVDILKWMDNSFCGGFLVHFRMLDKIPSPLDASSILQVVTAKNVSNDCHASWGSNSLWLITIALEESSHIWGVFREDSFREIGFDLGSKFQEIGKATNKICNHILQGLNTLAIGEHSQFGDNEWYRKL